MKKLILLLSLLPLFSKAQDTIVTRQSDTINCKITQISDDRLWYEDSKGTIREMKFNNILSYKQQKTPEVKSWQNIEADTTQNAFVKPKIKEFTDVRRIHIAGRELQRFHAKSTSGMLFMILGSFIYTAAILNPLEAQHFGFQVLGPSLFTVGLGLHISSFWNVRKAGKHLQNYLEPVQN